MDFYSDNDRHAAAWMRELIAQSCLPNGTVDERDFREVTKADIEGRRRCHFFAGIGGWAYALELAGWPATRPVWTASLPCQPFSAAGKRKGRHDDRHLWPGFFRIVGKCRPATLFGEQVDSSDGLEWLARVQADLESEGYAVGRASLPAASVAAPHKRHRLFWVAHAEHDGGRLDESGREAQGRVAGERLMPVADNQGQRQRQRDTHVGRGDCGVQSQGNRRRPADGRGAGSVADARRPGDECGLRPGQTPRPNGTAESKAQHQQRCRADTGRGRVVGYWSRFDIVHCKDGKARRVEPGVFPLAHGIPFRVVKLRGYGNAIVPQVAALFIRCFLDAGY